MAIPMPSAQHATPRAPVSGRMLLRVPKRLANDWNAQREHDHGDNDETQADLGRP